MGLLESLKTKLTPAKGKVSHLAQQHGGKIEQGLDKAAKLADKKTKGKYSDKIQRGTSKAKGAVDRLAHDESDGTGGAAPPPPPTPPPPSAS
jgi:hypothetical protein